MIADALAYGEGDDGSVLGRAVVLGELTTLMCKQVHGIEKPNPKLSPDYSLWSEAFSYRLKSVNASTHEMVITLACAGIRIGCGAGASVGCITRLDD